MPLDALYLGAAACAVVFGSALQLAIALPVAAYVGVRVVHRRRMSSVPRRSWTQMSERSGA